jgi:hypothetical protein
MASNTERERERKRESVVCGQLRGATGNEREDEGESERVREG